MSKTFKSAFEDSSYRLEVGKNLGAEHLSLWIVGRGLDSTSIAIDPSDAPALALAILEAAGYGEEVVTDGSPDGHIQVAKYYLYEGVKAHASIAAEAEAQAKLEAEALELFNARQEAINSFDWEPYKDFANEDSKQTWLAVARRAREINKETPQCLISR